MIPLNTLYKANLFDLFSLIPDKSVDCVLMDLPFGKTKNTWDKPIDLIKFWVEVNRIKKSKHTPIILHADNPFTADLIYSNRKIFRYSLVWEKTNPKGHLNASRMPMRSHEDILVFYEKLPIYNPQKTIGHPRKVSSAVHKRNSKKTSNYGEHGLTSYDSTERYPTSVWRYKSDTQKLAIHPTQKPVALIENLIKTYTNPGAIILDGCAGSFTLAEAADNLGRDWICGDLDEEGIFIPKAFYRINDNRKKIGLPGVNLITL